MQLEFPILWNEGLARLAQAEAEYSRAAQEDGSLGLNAEDKERVAALASDFPRVWKDPRTSARDRKRMLRLLIEDVTLVRDGELIRVHIRWKGGANTSLDVPRRRAYFELVRTSDKTIEAIRALAVEQTDTQVAQALNSRNYRSGAGKSFTGLMVRQLRLSYGIESYGQRLRRIGWLTVPEIACRIGVHPTTARTYAKNGILRAMRINDKGDLLFEPTASSIPRTHRGKRYRDSHLRSNLTSQMRNEVQYET